MCVERSETIKFLDRKESDSHTQIVKISNRKCKELLKILQFFFSPANIFCKSSKAPHFYVTAIRKFQSSLQNYFQIPLIILNATTLHLIPTYFLNTPPKLSSAFK